MPNVVYHGAVQHTGVGVLLLDIQIIARDLVIERAFGNLQLRTFLTGREQQRPHLDLCLWQHVVLEEERADGYYGYQHDKGRHDLYQRNAAGLDGGKLRLLAKIAERHQRRQQDGQRQRHRYHGEGGVEEKFGQHSEAEALAHQIVHVFPQKLHEHDEQHDEERHREHRQECLEYEPV